MSNHHVFNSLVLDWNQTSPVSGGRGVLMRANFSFDYFQHVNYTDLCQHHYSNLFDRELK